jgi:hypothetical protein
MVESNNNNVNTPNNNMDGRRATRRDSVCSRSSFDQISPTFSARLQYFFSDLTTEPILLVVAVMAQLCGNRRLEYLFGLPHEEPSMVSTIRRTADGISVRGFSRYLPLCILSHCVSVFVFRSGTQTLCKFIRASWCFLCSCSLDTWPIGFHMHTS